MAAAAAANGENCAAAAAAAAAWLRCAVECGGCGPAAWGPNMLRPLSMARPSVAVFSESGFTYNGGRAPRATAGILRLPSSLFFFFFTSLWPEEEEEFRRGVFEKEEKKEKKKERGTCCRKKSRGKKEFKVSGQEGLG